MIAKPLSEKLQKIICNKLCTKNRKNLLHTILIFHTILNDDYKKVTFQTHTQALCSISAPFGAQLDQPSQFPPIDSLNISLPLEFLKVAKQSVFPPLINRISFLEIIFLLKLLNFFIKIVRQRDNSITLVAERSLTETNLFKSIIESNPLFE